MSKPPALPQPLSNPPTRLAARFRPRRLSLLLCLVALAGCQQGGPSPEAQRINQLELKIQQLESRLNQLPSVQATHATNGKLPAGSVKSLTYRTGDQGNRLRIYWADGSVTDLECNQEQSTLACG